MLKKQPSEDLNFVRIKVIKINCFVCINFYLFIYYKYIMIKEENCNKCLNLSSFKINHLTS